MKTNDQFYDENQAQSVYYTAAGLKNILNELCKTNPSAVLNSFEKLIDVAKEADKLLRKEQIRITKEKVRTICGANYLSKKKVGKNAWVIYDRGGRQVAMVHFADRTWYRYANNSGEFEYEHLLKFLEEVK